MDIHGFRHWVYHIPWPHLTSCLESLSIQLVLTWFQVSAKGVTYTAGLGWWRLPRLKGNLQPSNWFWYFTKLTQIETKQRSVWWIFPHWPLTIIYATHTSLWGRHDHDWSSKRQTVTSSNSKAVLHFHQDIGQWINDGVKVSIQIALYTSQTQILEIWFLPFLLGNNYIVFSQILGMVVEYVHLLPSQTRKTQLSIKVVRDWSVPEIFL